MMRIFVLVILLGLLSSCSSPASPHNPLTSKPEIQHKAPEPLFKSRLLTKIV